MGNSAFPLKIVYVDTDEIKVVKRPEDIDAGRSFIIIQTQYPAITRTLFLITVAIAFPAIAAYLHWG